MKHAYGEIVIDFFFNQSEKFEDMKEETHEETK